MTAQIDDKFHYHNKEYSVGGISEGKLFDFSEFGIEMEPGLESSACWRGYMAYFALSVDQLILDDLFVNLLGEPNEARTEQPLRRGREINGVIPVTNEDMPAHFNNHYRRLHYELDYSGGILIADDFIQGLYVHMGFQKPWKYETVIELVFEEGQLIKETDQSEKMAEFRENLLNPDSTKQQPGYEGIFEYVEESFDRSYGIADEGSWGKA